MHPRGRHLARREGRICLHGNYPDPILVDSHPTRRKRATVIFPCWVNREHDDELADVLAAGRVVIEPLITYRFSFSEAADAFDLVAQ